MRLDIYEIITRPYERITFERAKRGVLKRCQLMRKSLSLFIHLTQPVFKQFLKTDVYGGVSKTPYLAILITPQSNLHK